MEVRRYGVRRTARPRRSTEGNQRELDCRVFDIHRRAALRDVADPEDQPSTATKSDWSLAPESHFEQAAYGRTVTTAEGMVRAITEICQGREGMLLGSPLQVTFMARQDTQSVKEFRLVIARPKIFGGI